MIEWVFVGTSVIFEGRAKKLNFYLRSGLRLFIRNNFSDKRAIVDATESKVKQDSQPQQKEIKD